MASLANFPNFASWVWILAMYRDFPLETHMKKALSVNFLTSFRFQSSSSDHPCPISQAMAECIDTPGSFICECRQGFEGDGLQNCSNVNECEKKTNNCHVSVLADHSECAGIRNTDDCVTYRSSAQSQASCSDTEGSFFCECKTGYQGSGAQCNNIDECSTEIDDCDV